MSNEGEGWGGRRRGLVENLPGCHSFTFRRSGGTVAKGYSEATKDSEAPHQYAGSSTSASERGFLSPFLYVTHIVCKLHSKTSLLFNTSDLLSNALSYSFSPPYPPIS